MSLNKFLVDKRMIVKEGKGYRYKTDFHYKKSVLLWNASVLKLKNEGSERMIRISEQERPLPF